MELESYEDAVQFHQPRMVELRPITINFYDTSLGEELNPETVFCYPVRYYTEGKSYLELRINKPRYITSNDELTDIRVSLEDAGFDTREEYEIIWI